MGCLYRSNAFRLIETDLTLHTQLLMHPLAISDAEAVFRYDTASCRLDTVFSPLLHKLSDSLFLEDHLGGISVSLVM